VSAKYVVSTMSKSARFKGRYSVYVKQSSLVGKVFYAKVSDCVENLGSYGYPCEDIIQGRHHARGSTTWELCLVAGLKVSSVVPERICDALNSLTPDGAEFVLENDVEAFDGGKARTRLAADAEHAIETLAQARHRIHAAQKALLELVAVVEGLEGEIREIAGKL